MVDVDDIDCLDLQGPASSSSGLSCVPIFVPPLPFPPLLPQVLKLQDVPHAPLLANSQPNPFPLWTSPDVKPNPRPSISRSFTQETAIKPEPIETPPNVTVLHSTHNELKASTSRVPEFLRPSQLAPTQPYPQTRANQSQSVFELPNDKQNPIFLPSQGIASASQTPKMLIADVALQSSQKHVSLFNSQRSSNKPFELPSEIRGLSVSQHNPVTSQIQPIINRPGEIQPVMAVVEARKRIPGPAGDFQLAGLKNKRSEEVGRSRYSFDVEGGDISGARYSPDQDEEFTKGPWLAVLKHLNVTCDDQAGSPEALKSTSEGMKAFTHNTKQLQESGFKAKVSSLALVVKSIAFWNDNASVTFKDPWGTIDGSVHPQVWKQFPRLTVGSAVLLSNITVFTPQSGNHYLNVVAANVCEVYHASTPAPVLPPPAFLSSPIPSSPRLTSKSFPFDELPVKSQAETVCANENEPFSQPSFLPSPMPSTPVPLFSASPLPSRFPLSTPTPPATSFPFSSPSQSSLSEDTKGQRLGPPPEDDVDKLLEGF